MSADTPPCQAYGQSPMVFLGTITDALAMQEEQTVRARMRVDRVYKGVSEKTVIVFDDGMCDGPDLEIGQQYLMYTRRLGDDGVPSRGCTRSRNVKDAAEDLQYLDGLADASPLGEISGQVIAWPDQSGGDIPMLGAAVMLQGEDGTLTTIADGDGHYSFSELKPSTYRVSARQPGFRMPAFEHQGVGASVQARACAVANIALRKNWPATIHGRLTRPDGTPAEVGVDLQLIRMEGSGSEEWSAPLLFEDVETNEQGEYSFVGVAPGRYKIVMHPCCFPTPSVPYSAIYWPSGSTESDGSEIEVTTSAVSQRYDFHLPPEVKSMIVRGIVLLADGEPAQNATVQILKLPEHAITGTDSHSDASGRFSFTAMEGLDYSLTALGTGELPLRSADLNFSLRQGIRRIVLVLNQ